MPNISFTAKWAKYGRLALAKLVLTCRHCAVEMFGFQKSQLTIVFFPRGVGGLGLL